MAIMDFSKTALKNLRSRPATLMYPARKREFFERTRGHIDIKIEDCIYCGICMRRCPSKAIAVVKGDKSWGIDRLKCVQCNACVENCPKKCLTMRQTYTTPSGGQVKDEFRGQ